MENAQTQPNYLNDIENVCAALMKSLENQKEKERKTKEEKNQLNDLRDHFNEVVKYIIIPNLMDRFDDFSHYFTESCNPCKIKSEKNNISLHIDVLLQNENTAMLVDTKFEFTIDDINKHINLLEKMRNYADLSDNNRNKQRKYLGAIAGVIIEANEREYALNQGFFLIEPSGEDYNITPPYDKPRVW